MICQSSAVTEEDMERKFCPFGFIDRVKCCSTVEHQGLAFPGEIKPEMWWQHKNKKGGKKLST